MIEKVKNRIQDQIYYCSLCDNNFAYQGLQKDEPYSDDVPKFCPECGKRWNATE